MATKKQADLLDEKIKSQSVQLVKQEITIKELQESLKNALFVAGELKQDYLELALSTQRSATKSVRILNRYSIASKTILTEGPKTND